MFDHGASDDLLNILEEASKKHFCDFKNGSNTWISWALSPNRS